MLLLAWVARVGEYALLVADTAAQAPRRPLEWRRTLAEMESLGVRSLLVIAITALFTGMVLALQTSHSLKKFGATVYVAEVVSLSVVRELGPVLAALIFAGRVGAGIAAEIGSMVVTEQVDAIRTLGASPVKKVVVPKVLAAMLMLPSLTVLADLIGILGGLLVSTLELQISPSYYLARVEASLDVSDVMSGVSKSLFFGFFISTIACQVGLRTSGGADGVGRSTTRSVVLGSMAVLISDFFLTKLFLVLPEL